MFSCKFLFLILFISISAKTDYSEPSVTDPGYEELLQWGLDHSLNITSKIRLIKEKDTKRYVAKNLIPEQEVIMDIPPECMMNLEKSLRLLNSKKFRKAYYQYIEEDKKNTEVLRDEHHVEQAFMAYILYIMNHKKKTYEKNKNKFYEYYKGIHYMFEDNLDSLPFYYSSEQMRFFFDTSFGSVLEMLNRYINEEVAIFEKKIFNKTLFSGDYLPYRIFTVQKGYEIDGKLNLVPYLDYFKKDFKSINCEFKIEDGHIIVKAKQNIFTGEELIMIPIAISNQHRLIFFGETYEEILDKFQSYSIPIIIPHYVTDKKITFDIRSLGGKSRIDLIEIDFYKEMINSYKKFAKMVDEDDSDEGACNLILKYISRLKEDLDNIKDEDVRNAFLKKKDSDNAIRIIEGERNFLERRINIMKIYIRNLKDRQSVTPDHSAEDVNDL